MMGFIIVAIIIFALIQKRRYRRMCARGYDRWSRKFDRIGRRKHDWDFSEDWRRWSSEWNCRSQEWNDAAHDVEAKAREFQRKVEAKIQEGAEKFSKNAGDIEGKIAEKLEYAASKIEREADKIRRRRGEPTRSEQRSFKSEEERRAYERARKRAAAEAGFYMHLMWYGIIIGFLFLLNMVTSPFTWWWLWVAFFWGFGVGSHYAAVYGWRWVHERIFQPAIEREVQREVTIEKEVLATEKQASLDELTASFAHEIRNPIAAAKSLVQQMGEDPVSQENVEYAKVALEELARVERSVSHLLKYAKEEDYNFDNVNLASVLDAALTQMRSKLEANHVSVSRNYIGGPTVRADADKLRQVFSNIIDNAIDAMEKNTGERHLDLAIRSNVAGMATAAVRDNGCGIPEDKLPKIFNPFYTTKQTGTGLGMGIARKVVDSHRGKIDMQSKVGEGTEFSISIPLADAAREWVQAELNGAAPTPAAGAPAQPGPQPAPTSTMNGSAPTTPIGSDAAMRARQ